MVTPSPRQLVRSDGIRDTADGHWWTGDVISDVSSLSTKLIQISRGCVSLQNNQQRPKIMTHLPVNYPAISMEVTRRLAWCWSEKGIKFMFYSNRGRPCFLSRIPCRLAELTSSETLPKRLSEQRDGFNG